MRCIGQQRDARPISRVTAGAASASQENDRTAVNVSRCGVTHESYTSGQPVHSGWPDATGSQACAPALFASSGLASSSFLPTSDSRAPAPSKPATAAIPFVRIEASGSTLSVASTAAIAPATLPISSSKPILITVSLKRERALFHAHAYQRTSRLESSSGDTSSSFTFVDEYAHLECATTRGTSYVDDGRLTAIVNDNITA